MTYTVKNGTWCKDNQGEYLSTTLTGLKAMRKAGQVPEGTRVVVHEPRQPAGTIIQSLNPNPPEGFMIPDGSAFDTEVYTDLAALFTDGKLPDLREYVLVCAGQNEHITTHAHDVFEAGEFKDDQAQLVEHDHDVTDPGHTHGITDPGHSHTLGYEQRNQDGSGHRCDNFSIKEQYATTEPATTGITVDSAETGITVNVNGNNDVTRTKQFGVYYYIAF